MIQRVIHKSSLRTDVDQAAATAFAKRPLNTVSDDELFFYFTPNVTYLGLVEEEPNGRPK